VVDDSVDLLEYFQAMARKIGFPCDAAEDGPSALKLIEEGRHYDIFFVDWRMPGMDGIELTRLIREIVGNKAIAIMISSLEWTKIEEEAKAAGVDGFISKPLFPSHIVDCFNRYLSVPETAGSPDETAEPLNLSGRSVLLAEDIEINQEIVSTLLEPYGVKVRSIKNGVEAVREFNDHPYSYDIIFMDVHMPEMDGYEATRRIRALDTPRAREIPIIAMTADVFAEDIAKCKDAGMDDHIGKPLDIEQVLAVLTKYTGEEAISELPPA
jgi:CheY-like chemotaxis protein